MRHLHNPTYQHDIKENAFQLYQEIVILPQDKECLHGRQEDGEL